MKKRALISLTNRAGLAQFASGLIELRWELISTGGTAAALEKVDLQHIAVQDVTGFPEILDGRVKTLHPKIHGGILFDRTKPTHAEEMNGHKIDPIDMIVVNLYDFAERPCLERIDIGGVALIRAAAKNFPDVIVIVDPADYPEILDKLRQGELTTMERQKLAAKALRIVAVYDTLIADHFEAETLAGREVKLGTH